MLTRTVSCNRALNLGLASLVSLLLAACGAEEEPQAAAESAPAPMSATPPVAAAQIGPTPQPPSQQERTERARNKTVVASFMEVLGNSAA